MFDVMACVNGDALNILQKALTLYILFSRGHIYEF